MFVEYSDVSNNHAVNSGGVLYCNKNSSITSNSDMSNAPLSRVTEYHFCNVFIRNNSRIIYNHAYNNGRGLYNDGNFFVVGEKSHFRFGGGVYGYKYIMVLNGNTFTLNTAVLGGGAMCLKDSHPTEIDNSTFSHSVVTYLKGAAIQSHAVLIRLVQCTVNNNTTIECGAIEATMIEISDSMFRSNNAAGLDEVGGGGVLCVRSGYISVERSIFEHNMAMKQSGVMIVENSTLRMLDTTFVNNRASWIGGIKASSSSVSIINCQFCNSTGTVETGIMRADGCSIDITGSIFHNNSVFGSTGVMNIQYSKLNVRLSMFSQTSAKYRNSVLQAQESIITVENCTFMRNTAVGYGMIGITSNTIITVSSSHFSDNRVTFRGGIFNIKDSAIHLKESTFRNSMCKNKGVLAIRSIFTVISCYFTNNHTTMSGGVFDIEDARSLTIWTSLLIGNTATGRDGGVAYYL